MVNAGEGGIMITDDADLVARAIIMSGAYEHNWLNGSPFLDVPQALQGEERAPDSIQFNLVGLSDAETDTFVRLAENAGVKVQVFGASADNARAFWNWQFIENIPQLPQTRAMLARACDVRLPVRLTMPELDAVTDVLLTAIAQATPESAASAVA